MNKLKSFLLIAIFLFSLSGCTTSAGPWRGKVIDTETKQPIEGVGVVAVWQRTIWLSPTGADVSYLDAAEAVTDKNGEFSISSKWFLSIPVIREVKLVTFKFFKPGYSGRLPDSSYDTWDEYYSVNNSKQNSGLTELEQLSSMKERYSVYRNVRTLLLEAPESKIPHLSKLMKEEDKNIIIPKSEEGWK